MIALESEETRLGITPTAICIDSRTAPDLDYSPSSLVKYVAQSTLRVTRECSRAKILHLIG
jgi:hypothetical protein